MADDLEPLSYDPSKMIVKSMLDLHEGEPWYLSNGGEYDTFAVYAFKKDGTDGEILVALQWPTRINRTDIKKFVQLLIHPDDARGLAEVLNSTCDWLDAAKRISG
jgi:hypothetical protein